MEEVNTSEQAACWVHFKKKAQCKHCNKILSADPTNGTSHLNRHYIETCPVLHPDRSRPGRRHCSPADAFVVQEASNSLHLHISDHLGQHRRGAMAAAAAKDEQFIRFTKMLYPELEMPSQEDVEESCNSLFDQEMNSLKDAIERTPGLVSLSVCETNTAVGKVVYTAVHFIDGDWNLHNRVVQLFKVSNRDDPSYEKILDIQPFSANNENNYVRMKETISSRGLSEKLCSCLLRDCGDILRDKLKHDNHLATLSDTQHELLRSTGICFES